MCRVLLVDDDPATMDGTGRLLQMDGYDVAWAPTGREGIRAAEASPPDIALIDLRLPDISGIDVVEQIRKQNLQIACVILTGFYDLAPPLERCGSALWTTSSNP
jgi:two-component system response regulator YesN